MEVKDTEVFFCECSSVEHQIIFSYDKDHNETSVYVNLSQYLNFFKRIKVAIKYIFGHKSIYGHFDSFLLKPEDSERLIEHLKKIKPTN